MGIKHKSTATRADGPNDGRVQSSWWNDDHEIGAFLSAIIDLAITPGTAVFTKADGTMGQFPISDFARSVLASIDAATLLNAIGGAPVSNAVLGGTPTLATSPDPTDSTLRIATMAAVQGAVARIVNSAPTTLDTLKELADALGDDPNFATTTATALGNRLRFDAAQTLTAPQKAQAIANLGIVLGTAAALNVGTGANQIVQLDGSGKLPAVDGSALINIAPTGAVLYTTAAQGLTATQQANARANIGNMPKNRAINGRFAIDQVNNGAAVSLPSNSYFCDGWRVLVESGNVWGCAMRTDVGFPATDGFVQAQAANLKFGCFQPIENANIRDMFGGVVTFSAFLSVDSVANLTNVKMAIVQYVGSKDAVSANPVSSWNAAGTNPTLAGNWSYVNAPANLGLNPGGRFSVSGTVSTSANNLGLLVWVDSKTAAAGNTLYVADAQLELGPVATAFETRLIQQELDLCRRYLSVRNLTILNPFSTNVGIPQGQWFGFNVQMRIPPAFSVTNQVFSNCTSVSVDKPTVDGCRAYVTNTAAGASQADFTLAADARL